MKNSIRILTASILFIIGYLIGFTTHDFIKSISNNILLDKKTIKTSPSPVVIDEIKNKKDSLASFYNELVQAELNKDYEKSYEYYKPTLGTWVTKDEYIAYEKKLMEKKSIVSSELIIHNIIINGGEGIVDRTRIFCFSDKCEGNNKQVDHGTRKFVYIDGKWSKIPDREPSERALAVASYFFVNGSATDIKQRIESGSYGANNQNAALHFMALYYDDNPEQLVLDEASIEKHKAEASRPIYNYQPPDIAIEAPSTQQNPVNNSINCTSNKIGNYTYTNCY